MEQQQLLLVAVAAFFLGTLSGVRSWTSPDFCHEYECPEFTELSKNTEFEERGYLDSRWVSTRVPSTGMLDLRNGYNRLMAYFNGENVDGAVISSKTWPALISVTEKDNGLEEEVWVSWFAPTNTTLPNPTDHSITRETRPAANVYVRVFEGFPSFNLYQSNLKTLREALLQDGKSFEPRRYMAAAYDSLFSLPPHHNEILIYAA